MQDKHEIQKLTFQFPDKIRVIDLVTDIQASDLFIYDKKMSTVVTLIKYDNASDPSEKKALENDMHIILAEAYDTCHAEILKDSCYNDCILAYLDKLAREIFEVRQSQSISRDIIEVACFKLAILCDLSRGSTPSLRNNNAETLLRLPLTQISEFKTQVGSVGTGVLSQGYAEIKTILPVFSKNGSMGINTMLYAYFNNYHPVGFGAKPQGVHLGFHLQSVGTLQHDYGHMFRTLNLQNKSPETFEKYKSIYWKLLEQKQLNQLDDLAFKKDLFILFILTHEVGFYPGKNVPISDAIANRAAILEETSSDYPPQYLSRRILTEVVDFIKPLRKLGYKIADSSLVWQCSADIRYALMGMLKDFLTRHPETGMRFEDEIENGRQLIQTIPQMFFNHRFSFVIRRAHKIQNTSELLEVCTHFDSYESFIIASKVKHLIKDADELVSIISKFPIVERCQFVNQLLDRIQNQSELKRILKLLPKEDSLIIDKAFKDNSYHEEQLFKKNESSVSSDFISQPWCQFYPATDKVDKSERKELLGVEQQLSPNLSSFPTR